MVIDIASSPIFFMGHGCANRAVVLRAFVDDNGLRKYVVHDRYVYEDKTSAYGHGNYYDGSDSFFKAYEKFLERSRELIADKLAPVQVLVDNAIHTN